MGCGHVLVWCSWLLGLQHTEETQCQPGLAKYMLVEGKGEKSLLANSWLPAPCSGHLWL